MAPDKPDKDEAHASLELPEAQRVRRRLVWRRAESATLELIVFPYFVAAYAFLVVGACFRFHVPGFLSAAGCILIFGLTASYLLLHDWIVHGHGLFRPLFGIRVVGLRDNQQVTVTQSCLRNWPFALAWACFALPLLYYVPVVCHLDTWGGVAYIAFFLCESALVLSRRDMRRTGDLMAGTHVIEATEETMPSKSGMLLRRVLAYCIVIGSILITLTAIGTYIVMVALRKE